MPIRRELRPLYGPNWKAISLERREQAGWRCEGSPDFPDCRAEQGQPHPDTGSIVVLTVAHLNHDPRDNRPDNLRAWCQRCHLHHDREHHATNAHQTRRGRKALGDLFAEGAVVRGRDLLPRSERP